MTPRVLLLNGPAAVGKTTVSGLLAARTTGTIHISGDVLRRFAPADPELARAALGPGSTYHVGGALAAAYLQLGAQTVIFDYVFETPLQLDRFSTQLPPGISLSVITLWAALETLRRRR